MHVLLAHHVNISSLFGSHQSWWLVLTTDNDVYCCLQFVQNSLSCKNIPHCHNDDDYGDDVKNHKNKPQV